MTAGDVLTDARRMLNDEGGAPRWTTPRLLRYVSEAEREVRRLRPDLFFSSSAAMDTPADSTDLTDDLVLDEDSRSALVDLVCARALLEDAEDTQNRELALLYRSQAYDMLGVVSRV